MSVNFNLFSWVREGVKQSVLLGVSDAIQQIGSPPDARDLDPRLGAALQPRLGDPTSKGTVKSRRRLGRTLKDIETEQPKP